jgi:hypothetical protein
VCGIKLLPLKKVSEGLCLLKLHLAAVALLALHKIATGFEQQGVDGEEKERNAR